MINVSFSVQHSLGQDDAIKRMYALVNEMTQRFPQQVHQVRLRLIDHLIDVEFEAYGFLVSWRAEVFEDEVSLAGQLPDSAAPFQAKMQQVVFARVEEALRPVQMRAAA